MTKILPTPFEEQHGVVYYSFCGTENCSKNYFFKSARRLNEKKHFDNSSLPFDPRLFRKDTLSSSEK